MTHEIPNDENGNVLRQMKESGDDLSLPRDIDFTLVFPAEDKAVCFANYFRGMGYRVKWKLSAVVPSLPWDVVVVRHMVPRHAAIGEFESELQDYAGSLGGRNDGWGCFEQAGQKH